MDVFVCAGCGEELTAPLTRLEMPVYGRHSFGHDMLPPLMESGTYAVDPEPYGRPWRRWAEITAEEAAVRGLFAPVETLPFGPRGEIVVAPGDTRSTVFVEGRCDGYCLGVTGGDGPNLACGGCGAEVATRIDDCSLWQTVRFLPTAVRGRVVSGPAPARSPATLWRGGPLTEPGGWWDYRWEGEAGHALAHLLAASAGEPVALPPGLLTEMFGRSLKALLPPGPPARTAGLAGPGLPLTQPPPDIAFVPRHTRTGRPWQPPVPTAPVPLASAVWSALAFPVDPLPRPATDRMPEGVYRDDPLPPHPWRPFTPDHEVFLHTLARLPAVREPWLRAVYDRARPHGHPF
ncbi:hypothetical protein SRB5_67810 [Streptomyces sp. RB5]|uniref:Uncharacterized protein n=1 Tax=Streptomyces smaragdinus TaxID=2585196 RepID=A0A7K0CT09_9ACTN|nr:hypothetical protein [Streptomyces smaragdinus]MQY16580.1 hypothetical protein [Streptomyces smaragdinus]